MTQHYRIKHDAVPAAVRDDVAALLDIAHVALFHTCDVAKQLAVDTLKDSQHPDGPITLFELHYNPSQKHIRLDVHYHADDSFQKIPVILGPVREEYHNASARKIVLQRI